MRSHLSSLVTFILAFLPSVLSLWPQPTQLEAGSCVLQLAHDFDIKIDVPNAPGDLKDAIARTKGYLKNDKLERLSLGRGASDAQKIRAAKSLPRLTLTFTGEGSIRSISEEAVDDVEKRVEGYALVVPEDGTPATLEAKSSLGLFRGLTTFGQMWYEYDGRTYTMEAPFRTEDAPKYVSWP
jgi:hexosaminidase